MAETTTSAAQVPGEAKRYTARDPEKLGRTVVVWLYIELALQVAFIVTSVASLQFLSRLAPDQAVSWDQSLPGGEWIDAATGLVGLAWFAAYLVAAFLSLKWIYRVSRNAHSLASGLKIRPPWAVGWFFIPIAWLWMPFRGLREAWQASVEPHAWQSVPVPSLLRWWWGLWLASNFLGSISMRLTFQANTVGDLMVVAVFDILSGLVAIPLSLVFIRVVRQLTANQVNALQGATFD